MRPDSGRIPPTKQAAGRLRRVAKPVTTSDLRRHLDRYGTTASVITVSDDHRPHVVTSGVDLDDDRVLVRVGPRSAEHLRSHPDLCLIWAPPDGEDYLLIVDASAVEVAPDGEEFTVVASPTSGIRHRVADAASTGPTCITLDA